MSKDFMFDLFKGIDMTEEGIKKRHLELYNNSKINLENMSYWFPKISKANINGYSSLKLPLTKIIQLDFENWNWLRTDNYTEEAVYSFNNYLLKELGDFYKDEPLFMKTGIFSNKFDFKCTFIDNPSTIGRKFLDMFYTSMVYGADNTAEVVFRTLIKDIDNKPTIYNGMPLKTEYRVFYDFDVKDSVGVSNYWHPDLMEINLKGLDKEIYLKEKDNLVSEYESHKLSVVNEVIVFMESCEGLTGKWSIDVMKNGDDYWLIDMARMNRSGLVSEMEILSLRGE